MELKYQRVTKSHIENAQLNPLMNDTKWNEVRLAMYGMEPPPRWSVLNVNGYISPLDVEWYHHFRERGYCDIVYVDIFANDAVHKERIGTLLREIHISGSETDHRFRVYGYSRQGQLVDYL